VFWLEPKESFFDEEDCPDESQDEPDFEEYWNDAVSKYLDPRGWWQLYPVEVHPWWREAYADLLEQQFPGWTSAPYAYAKDEWPTAPAWYRILFDAAPPENDFRQDPSHGSPFSGKPDTRHPRPDHHGKPVFLEAPHTPSSLAAWQDPTAFATTTPGGPRPGSLNGLPIRPWREAPGGGSWAQVPGQGDFPEPPPPKGPGHLTAGAVILEPDGRVWTVSPSNAFGGYVNTFPKGHPDPGLGLRATAIKEAFEETGLQVELTGWLVDVTRTTSIARYYLARRLGGDPAAMGWESQAVHVVPMDQLAAHLNHPKVQPVLAAPSKHLGRSL
jgi:ADP-ribose pyrophosphatase YjhB (NUDIX family)